MGGVPLKPPRAWFADPGLPGPSALMVDDDGRVRGHLALWKSCHNGNPGRCVPPPRSRGGYRSFHVGELVVADGSRLAVGKLTVGGGHADLALGAVAAREHYDDVGAVAAFVRAGEDKHGIWVAGALRSDLSAAQLRDFRANPLSGDWRQEGTALELVAACSVPVPGFPVLRASAAPDGHDTSLVLTCSGLPAAVSRGPRWRPLTRAEIESGAIEAAWQRRSAARRLSSIRPAARTASAKPKPPVSVPLRRPRPAPSAEARFEQELERLLRGA